MAAAASALHIDPLTTLSSINEQDVAKYFTSNLHNIFQYAKENIVDTLEFLEPNIVDDIRSQLIQIVQKQFKDYRTKIAISRRAVERKIEDIYAMGYCCISGKQDNLDALFKNNSKHGRKPAKMPTPQPAPLKPTQLQQQEQ